MANRIKHYRESIKATQGDLIKVVNTGRVKISQPSLSSYEDAARSIEIPELTGIAIYNALVKMGAGCSFEELLPDIKVSMRTWRKFGGAA